jgi:uncharacterized protein
MFLPSESFLNLNDGDAPSAVRIPEPPIAKAKKVALVTGAASGIGRALVLEHARQGGNLVLVDKNSQGLADLKRALREEYKDSIQVTVIVADLSLPDGARSVYEQVKAASVQVDYLINNAGFAVLGSIIDPPVQSQLDLIQVMVTSVVTLTHLFAADMVASERGGKVLNVGSIASFMPGGPYLSCYFASKAFLSSFSQAVDHELRNKGVTCTLVAPGNTDTGLFAASGLNKTKMSRGSRLSPEAVARVGYQAMLDGRLHAVCDGRSGILSWLLPLLPRRKVLQIVEDFTLLDSQGA